VHGARRITGSLDKIVCNDIWLDTLPSTFYQYLNHSTIIFPMLLHLKKAPASKAKAFRSIIGLIVSDLRNW